MADLIRIAGAGGEDQIGTVAAVPTRPGAQAAWYFSLFLCIFPVIAFIAALWSGVVLLSLPLLIMLCCGILSCRATLVLINTGRK